MSTLGTPDFTSATPPPGSGSAAIDAEGGRQMSWQRNNADLTNTDNYMNSVQQDRTMPQLQSSLGASGNWYSGAAQKAEANSSQDFLKAGHDVASSFQRQQQDLIMSRMYSATGLIVG